MVTEKMNEGTLVKSKPSEFELKNIEHQKQKVLGRLKNKTEQAKLNLIFTELDELGITFDHSISSINKLKHNLKKNNNELDYNKSVVIIENIEKSLNEMIGNLEKGSTNAFTKLMTGKLSRTIAKTAGISMAGRTALILAPTIGSKAAVAAGLGTYGLYRIVKNRQDIIETNIENTLNNMLMEIETTKENGEYTDTRFSEDVQKEIRNYLNDLNIHFNDTGYRSLRQAIYSLDQNQKKNLIERLNIKLGKNINVEKRLKKARKKLNVIASTSSTIGVGAGVGVSGATVINSIDPGILAAPLNGTFLASWVKYQTGLAWFDKVAGALGLIGTEALEYVPVIGEIAERTFALENFIALGSIGATGGLVAGGTLAAASLAKNIYGGIKTSKDTKKFLSLDNSKYKEQDKKELELIKKYLQQPTNEIELIVIDIIMGYLDEKNIKLDRIPNSLSDLKESINNLNKKEQKIAVNIMENVNSTINGEPQFLNQLKKAGKISIGIFTAGLAALSVYDILRHGSFLPELSQKLFPENNLNTPVIVPDPYDKSLDKSDIQDKEIFQRGKESYDEFKGNEFKTEKDLDYFIESQNEKAHNSSGPLSKITELITGKTDSLLDKTNLDETITGFKHTVVPDTPKISQEISKLSPEELYELYRFYYTNKSSDNELYQTVGDILSYKSNLDKVTEYISGFEKTKEMHDLINGITSKVSTGVIPLSVALETLATIQKQTTTDEFMIEKNKNQKIL